ncbi:MAG: leucyl/phenylalanyl-tRNA--protein transferase [Trueperaceae bacterium]
MQLTPQMLLNAYCQGYFPMADLDDEKIYWYDPDPRTILPLESFHIPRRLQRTVRQKKFEIRIDTAFEQVMKLCAEPRKNQDRTWINEDLVGLYTALHHHGFAHSLETWLEDELVGGVYGVSVGGLFAGESMFSRARDASKVALVALVDVLKRNGYVLFDVQFTNDHLEQFGVIEIPKGHYKLRLEEALERQCYFY